MAGFREGFVRARLRSSVSLASVLVGISLSVTVREALAQGPATPPSQQAAAPSLGDAGSLSAQIQDVKVTGAEAAAQKLQEQVLTKTPRSGTIVTDKVIEEQQIETVTDISRRVPGYRPNLVQPRQSRMTIRGAGIAAASAGTGSPSDTGYIVDNVYWSFAGFQWGEFVDLSSVEVLYGPTGTAGTKNTNVGSIIMHTQLPSFVPKTTLRTSYGNYNHVRQTINSTGPLIEDALAYRLAFYLDKGDGWIRDARSGTTYLDTNRLGVHFQLFGVGDGWSDRLSLIYNGSNEQNGYLTAAIGDTSLVYANGTRPAQTYFQRVQQRLGKPIWTIDPNTPYRVAMGRNPTHVGMASNELNVAVGDYILTSITAGGFGSFKNYASQDDQLLDIGSNDMDTFGWQVSQEFRLSSPKEQELEWTIGTFTYWEFLQDRMHHATFGYDAPKWFKDPAAIPGNISWWLNKAGDIQQAAFGQATWHATEQFDLTFGLRDSWDLRYSSNKFRPTYNYWVPISIAEQDRALAYHLNYGWSDTGGATKGHNAIIGIINPKYQINENVQVYALIGRGDKQPAVNTQNTPNYRRDSATLSVTPLGWKPSFNKAETSWDYEIGAKTNWLDGALISNVNLYWNDLYDFQIGQQRVQTLADGATVTIAYLGNAPHVRLRGVEFVEQWRPFEGLTLNLSGAYTEARFVNYAEAPTPEDWAFPGGPATMSLSNTRINLLPKWQINGGYSFERSIGNVFAGLADWGNQPITAFTYLNASWFDKSQLTHPRSIVQYWQPDYVMLDAGLGLKTSDNRYSLTLWGKNLFDNRPWRSISLGSSTSPTNVGISTQGPRTFGVTSSITF